MHKLPSGSALGLGTTEIAVFSVFTDSIGRCSRLYGELSIVMLIMAFRFLSLSSTIPIAVKQGYETDLLPDKETVPTIDV